MARAAARQKAVICHTLCSHGEASEASYVLLYTGTAITIQSTECQTAFSASRTATAEDLLRTAYYKPLSERGVKEDTGWVGQGSNQAGCTEDSNRMVYHLVPSYSSNGMHLGGDE